MDDIDGLLGQLRNLPLDARLADIDSAVLDGVTQARRPALSGGGLAMVALVSLGTGLAGTFVPSSASVAAPVSALTAPGPLAPSTLLGAANE